jgi:hypothetical protein
MFATCSAWRDFDVFDLLLSIHQDVVLGAVVELSFPFQGFPFSHEVQLLTKEFLWNPLVNESATGVRAPKLEAMLRRFG